MAAPWDARRKPPARATKAYRCMRQDLISHVPFIDECLDSSKGRWRGPNQNGDWRDPGAV